MQYNIPADPAGKWRCIQIYWPDNDEWLWLLNGVLSSFAKGRVWAAESGNIKAAQAVGLQIREKNAILRACNGQIIIIRPDENNQNVEPGGTPGEELEDMPCIDLTALIRIHDGVLQVRNACCEWIDVGDLTTVTKPPTTPDPESPPADLACRKASIIIDALVGMGRQGAICNDNPEPLTFGHEWLGCFLAYYPWFSGWDLQGLLDNVYYELVDTGLTSGEVWDETLTTDEIQRAKCLLKNSLSANSLRVTNVEVVAVKTALQSAILNDGVKLILLELADQLNETGLTWLALDGEHLAGADCNCPAAPTPEEPDLWPNFGWYHRWDFADYATRPAVLLDGGQGSWLANVGLVSVDTGNTRDVWPKIDLTNGGGQINRVAFKLSLPAGGSNWDDNLIDASSVTIANQASFPVPAPYAADTEIWWTASCDIAVDLAHEPECTIFGYADGVPDGKRFKIIGMAIAGSGTDPIA